MPSTATTPVTAAYSPLNTVRRTPRANTAQFVYTSGKTTLLPDKAPSHPCSNPFKFPSTGCTRRRYASRTYNNSPFLLVSFRCSITLCTFLTNTDTANATQIYYSLIMGVGAARPLSRSNPGGDNCPFLFHDSPHCNEYVSAAMCTVLTRRHSKSTERNTVFHLFHKVRAFGTSAKRQPLNPLQHLLPGFNSSANFYRCNGALTSSHLYRHSFQSQTLAIPSRMLW